MARSVARVGTAGDTGRAGVERVRVGCGRFDSGMGGGGAREYGGAGASGSAMIDRPVSGKLHGAPSERISRDGKCGSAYLRRDDAANVVFFEWHAALENEMRDRTLHESHVSKYRKLVPGLALLVHLVNIGHGAIGDASMRRAVAWLTI
ncbi:DUF3987 domain-containing protein [Paraburkholderia sp. MMS20-SJTN17]|uniref:DUF3987 domain-containing protein n=1 Tax=Paraburkholderia translucens TaxID=2886945 RepID=A0ABS8KGP6_9BURK|nr:DUF3987 domain-containing protein [Paraburkholderia sp. MMS20-SJTN17]MCC8403870.1 DUF3987 domain-containing protein [Paraburkholderia sp. MMS20-SJTN17]